MRPIHSSPGTTRPTDPCPGFIADLLTRCARGEDAALGRIFDLFLPSVLGVVGNGISSQQTDTCVVETFHHVWLNAASFDPVAQDAVTWVLDQARFVCGLPSPARVPIALLTSAER